MNSALKGLMGRAAAVAVVTLMSACSYVPDAVNPVSWYNNTSDYFFGGDEPSTASSEPAPGADQPFPDLNATPQRPQPAPAPRRPMVEGLVADTAGSQQRYATDTIARQGDAVSPLRRDLSAPPAGVAAPPTGAAASAGLGTTPPPGDLSPAVPPPSPPVAAVPPGSTAPAGSQLLRPPAPPQQQAAVPSAPPVASRAAPSGPTSVEEVFRANLAQRLPPANVGGEQLPPVEQAQANAMPVPPMPQAQGPRQFGQPSAPAAAANRPATQSPLFPRSQPPANSVAPTLDRFDTVFVSSSGVQLGTNTPGAARAGAPAPSAVPATRSVSSRGVSTGEPASTASSAAPALNAGPSDTEITAYLSRQPGGAGPANRIATVVFSDGSAGLDERDKAVLRNVAGLYKERNPGTIRVAGHASHRTKNLAPVRHQMANYKVSLDRANAVKAELVRLGVPRDKIIADARSDGEPMYYEVMPSGEAGNRRTEIYFFGS
jgi:outer membrane protein OmpA-like peptidoglycan-associated protein